MRTHSLPQRFLFLLAGVLGRWVIGLYYRTIRIRNSPEVEARLKGGGCPPGVYAFWHAHQLSAVWHLRGLGAGVMISASRDGEYIARIARSLGFQPVRGSSSRRGAAGLKGMIELARRGNAVAITPDGPRGPRYTVHPGALAIAQKSGQPVTPFAIGLSRYWELPSWDRFRIPKPFARGYLISGAPLHVPDAADADTLLRLADELRDRMLALEQEADRRARER